LWQQPTQTKKDKVKPALRNPIRYGTIRIFYFLEDCVDSLVRQDTIIRKMVTFRLVELVAGLAAAAFFAGALAIFGLAPVLAFATGVFPVTACCK
jgi:hypothetical protein